MHALVGVYTIFNKILKMDIKVTMSVEPEI